MAASKAEQESLKLQEELENIKINEIINSFTDVSTVYTLNYKVQDEEYTSNVASMTDEYDLWIFYQDKPRVRDLYQRIQMYGKMYTIVYKETKADFDKSSRKAIGENHYTIYVIPETPQEGGTELENFIVKCELRSDDILYLEDFYYINKGKNSFAKPTQFEAIENYLCDHVVDEEYLSILLENASQIISEDELFDFFKIYFLNRLEFDNIVQGKAWSGYGQRGMRLVRLLKDITGKSKVKLTDAWQGKWKEKSSDIQTYFRWYEKGLGKEWIEFWLIKFQSPEGEDNGKNGFEGKGRWGEDGETVKALYSATRETAECVKYWFDVFKTPRGEMMGKNGFYGQWGFEYEEGGITMVANLEKGDISILDTSTIIRFENALRIF